MHFNYSNDIFIVNIQFNLKSTWQILCGRKEGQEELDVKIK